MSNPLVELSNEERAAVMTQVADMLKESDLADAKVKLVRETVCPIKADKVEENFTIQVEKSCPSEKQASIDTFKEKAKDLIEKYKIAT